jgi:hypothetical protein
LTPADAELFEQRYSQKCVPMAAEKLVGKPALCRVADYAQRRPEQAPFHRIADVCFPSMQGFVGLFKFTRRHTTVFNREAESFDFRILV